MTYYANRSRERSAKGSYVVELPGVLLIIFLMFVFPLINLGTTALRYGLLMAAARDGAHAASKCYTFEVGSANKPPAVSAAPTAVNRLVGQFSGLSVQNVDVDIVITNLTTNQVTRSEGRLAQPADASQNVYCIETEVTGQLEPLIPFKGPCLPAIPGMTTAWTARVISCEFAESPQGLNQ